MEDAKQEQRISYHVYYNVSHRKHYIWSSTTHTLKIHIALENSNFLSGSARKIWVAKS